MWCKMLPFWYPKTPFSESKAPSWNPKVPFRNPQIPFGIQTSAESHPNATQTLSKSPAFGFQRDMIDSPPFWNSKTTGFLDSEMPMFLLESKNQWISGFLLRSESKIPRFLDSKKGRFRWGIPAVPCASTSGIEKPVGSFTSNA